jgi:hypothetical protein
MNTIWEERNNEVVHEEELILETQSVRMKS